MRSPLWLDVRLEGSTAHVSLARCRNCGKTKVSSDPCSLDHLAALLEFREAHPSHQPPARDRRGER